MRNWHAVRDCALRDTLTGSSHLHLIASGLLLQCIAVCCSELQVHCGMHHHGSSHLRDNCFYYINIQTYDVGLHSERHPFKLALRTCISTLSMCWCCMCAKCDGVWWSDCSRVTKELAEWPKKHLQEHLHTHTHRVTKEESDSNT